MADLNKSLSGSYAVLIITPAKKLFSKGICCNSDINNDVGEINKSIEFDKAGCFQTRYF